MVSRVGAAPSAAPTGVSETVGPRLAAGGRVTGSGRAADGQAAEHPGILGSGTAGVSKLWRYIRIFNITLIIIGGRT